VVRIESELSDTVGFKVPEASTVWTFFDLATSIPVLVQTFEGILCVGDVRLKESVSEEKGLAMELLCFLFSHACIIPYWEAFVKRFQ
jgi:hypothetical protein